MGIAVLVPEMVLYCAWEQWWASKRLMKVVEGLGARAFDGVGGEVEGWGDGDGGDMEGETCVGCIASGRGRDSEDYGLERLFRESGSVCEKAEVVVEHVKTSAVSRRMGFKMSKLSFRAKKKNSKLSSATNSPKPPAWTKQQAFFALSGGYTVSTSTFHPSPQQTLTPPSLLFLARLGLLPNTPLTTISDKSKADVVAKLLVCIQAAWFLIQCVGRLAQRLPLTLLELHVLAHVGCAFVMYVLWLDKPYDVGASVEVEDERVRNLVALWAVDDGSVGLSLLFSLLVVYWTR